MNIRTDLALEAQEMIDEQKTKKMNNSSKLPEGMSVDTLEKNYVVITKINITSDEAANKIGKKKGKYITIELKNPDLNTLDIHKELASSITECLLPLISQLNKKEPSVMVVGLGNKNITPDSLGPKVVDKIVVTRHVKTSEQLKNTVDKRLGTVSAVSPGVMGTTGIETGEILKGLIEKAGPDIIFVIDALCARKTNRINTTIQISTTGIVPGSGVGNHRMELSSDTLGVPVVAIGVPTVVDSVTIAYDIINNLEGNSVDEDVINSIARNNAGNMVVTPKNIDISIDRMSLAISNGINMAVHKGFDIGDVSEYLL